MAIRWFERTEQARYINERACAMADADCPEILVVEVFDHPGAGYNKKTRLENGPWLIGPPEEVLAELERQGHVEWIEIARAYGTREAVSADKCLHAA
jgi:hypothetical protein